MRNAPIRPGLVYPRVAAQTGGFDGKRLMDIGCGNGNLIHHFREAGFCEWHGVDTGREILASAAKHVDDPRVAFTHLNPLNEFSFDKTGKGFDALSSVFVMEKIPAPHFPAFCHQVHELLKPGGTALIFTNHPANAMREDMLHAADAGHLVKFQGLRGYFDERPSEYTLSALNQERGFETKVAYHHKPLSAIVNAFTRAGLSLKDMPEVPAGIVTLRELENHPPKPGDSPRFLGLTFERRL